MHLPKNEHDYASMEAWKVMYKSVELQKLYRKRVMSDSGLTFALSISTRGNRRPLEVDSFTNCTLSPSPIVAQSALSWHVSRCP